MRLWRTVSRLQTYNNALVSSKFPINYGDLFSTCKKITVESKAASTTGYSDSGRGTMTHCQSTIADDEEPDHTFNSVHHHDSLV